MKRIKYVSDVFLDKFKTNFEMDYLKYYQEGDVTSIKTLFAQLGNIIESNLEYDYNPLILGAAKDETTVSKNVRILWKSLGSLKPTQAENEKLWVALENTDYLDYHLDQLAQINVKNRDTSLISRTIFNNGRKRSLFINNLALLWWIVYYLIDERDEKTPYRLVDYLSLIHI